MSYKKLAFPATNLILAAVIGAYVYSRAGLYPAVLAVILHEAIWIPLVMTFRDLSGLRFLLNPGSIFVISFLLFTVYAALNGYGNQESTLFGIGAALVSIPIGILISQYWNI